MEEVGGFTRQGGDVVIPRRHDGTRLILAQNKTADRSEHVEMEVKRSLRKEASVTIISAILVRFVL
jgi:hypothetical protein